MLPLVINYLSSHPTPYLCWPHACSRPIVEWFINGGRAAFTHAAADFSTNETAVHIFNSGKAELKASHVSVHGMGCGWTDVLPKPQGDTTP